MTNGSSRMSVGFGKVEGKDAAALPRIIASLDVPVRMALAKHARFSNAFSIQAGRSLNTNLIQCLTHCDSFGTFGHFNDKFTLFLIFYDAT